MKKNKTIAYMMAAMLLVGGTFVGTKALFYNELDTIGELAISTGDVDIAVSNHEDEGWELSRNGGEYGDGTTIKVGRADSISGELPESDTWDDIDSSTPRANNLKPGDELTKTVKIKNTGTLVAQLELTQDQIENKLGVLKGLITATGEVSKPFIKPGEEATVKLTLKVSNLGGKHNEEGSFNTDDIENTKINLKDAWKLKATQQNNKSIK